eukprot:CAMPEP_0195516210 /NCGR_PEP_ID=MMETSP0794_2-20130614/7000_1 /TAXON_ID=515487 /ORGANISM="Stephanopyxis turris, Strain CCMP 815" /LENGTH=333 /DNA_ID=CAMNT_0040644745 /DNA_START=57 /DNA_END=1058 /DNA_ORIENTATION=+
MTIEEEEKNARSKCETRPIVLFLLNGISAFVVFGKYLISLDSILGCALTVGFTLLAYFLNKGNEDWYGTMDWVLLSFAVVMPISTSIGLAFGRRELALKDISIFRSNAHQIYLAHSCWDWGTTTTKEDQSSSARDSSDYHDWLAHADETLSILLGIGDEICRFLTLPPFTRARHKVTRPGRKEAARTTEVADRLFHSFLTTKMAKLTRLTELLKKKGLPPNEASRIRQWERLMGEAIEDLRMIKAYRTPQALRSFSRLFSVFLPPLYAPSIAQLAHDTNSLGLGIMFAIITSIALTALFESVSVLEDPFTAHLTLDGIGNCIYCSIARLLLNL